MTLYYNRDTMSRCDMQRDDLIYPFTARFCYANREKLFFKVLSAEGVKITLAAG